MLYFYFKCDSHVSNTIAQFFAKFYLNWSMYWNVIAIFHFQGFFQTHFSGKMCPGDIPESGGQKSTK